MKLENFKKIKRLRKTNCKKYHKSQNDEKCEKYNMCKKY